MSNARLDSFSAIVERHQDLVCAIAFAATGDAATSDDVVQETFLADGGDTGESTATEGPSPLERMLSDEKMTQVTRGLLEMPRASRALCPFLLGR